MVSVGDIIEGKIVSVMPFGVFVDLGKRQSGLVHISELSRTYVKDINDVVKKGDVVKAKVIKIDENNRISLSMKQAEPEQQQRREKIEKKSVRPADIDWGASSVGEMSFEDKLSKFKQDSDEKIQILKRNSDSKRSGGYSRKNNYSF